MPLDINFNYYSTNDFQNNDEIANCFSKKAVSFVHCNIRSLSANHDRLIDMLSDLFHPFSIIGLTETKLHISKNQIINTELPGYHFLSQPSLSNAGGTGFYIQNHLNFSVRSDLSKTESGFEALWIEVLNEKQSNLLCGTIYRHPNGNIDEFLEYLNTALEKTNSENKPCVIMGDFNLNLLKFESHNETDSFLNSMLANFFQPHILQPTRITDHSATLIDNIFLNSLNEYFTISGNIIYDLTDHLANFLIINNYSSLPNKIKMYKRDYTNFNENKFIEDCQAINWKEIISTAHDPNCIFDSFYYKLSDLIDAHIPIKRLSKRELRVKTKPWITPAIKTAIQKKNELYKKYLKTKSPYYYTKFKYYRNKINHLLKISKKTYYNEYFSQSHGNPKRLWTGIKRIINNKSKTNRIPTKLTNNNNNITDPKEIADTFNNYFANIGENLARAIPSTTQSAAQFLKPNSYYDSFFLFPTTSSEIEAEITKLNPSKASGPFSIPTKILQLVKHIISKPLEIILNYSFSSGIVPDKFKIARVLPVFKSGLESDVSNYRPISLLSVFNRIMEKLVYNRLIKFVEKHDIIYKKQFGFRSFHSTEHAILSIVDKIQDAIEKNEFSCGIFLDFRKAFDTVNHHVLIQKLDHYGIRGIAKSWFISYLTNRKQFTSVGNANSEEASITCGVPQGSVLGPLLFLIYINDFSNCSASPGNFDLHLFADDSNLFFRHKSLTQLELIINTELKHVHNWLCANKLSLNIDKSNFVIFRPPQKKIASNFDVSINQTPLKLKENVKYLGLILDSHLNWKEQVQTIAKKIKRNIGILSKLRHYLNFNILINLYYSFIYPFLIYGLITWGNTYETNINPVYILQKRAVRTITFSKFDEHSSHLFKLTKIIKFFDLIKFQISVFMYKYNNKKLPSVFNNYFRAINDVHNYNTRLSANQSFSVPYARTNYGIFNIRFVGAKVWNTIDPAFKTFSINTFKARLKESYISKY